MENSEVVLVSERNDAGLKKVSQVLSDQTNDSSTFQNTMCLLKYVLNCEENFYFLFFIFRCGLSDVRINCDRISEGFLYVQNNDTLACDVTC
jgi:hypothetical protein